MACADGDPRDDTVRSGVHLKSISVSPTTLSTQTAPFTDRDGHGRVALSEASDPTNHSVPDRIDPEERPLVGDSNPNGWPPSSYPTWPGRADQPADRVLPMGCPHPGSKGTFPQIENCPSLLAGYS